MTVSTRGSMPRLVIAVALALFAWTHRHALAMSGFADDLGVLADLSQRAGKGTLLSDVLNHVIQPLWPGSTMWRPLSYASFAVDAKLWGANAGLWRITNLVLHLASASVAGLICRNLTQQARAGAFGFAAFLLVPWSSEVVIWLAGRFDGWATLYILLALWAALKSGGFDRWWGVSLVAAACAYASKESALILPLWIALLALYAAFREASTDPTQPWPLTRTLKQPARLLIGHTLLATAYLLGRAMLFSTASLNVYAAGPQSGIEHLITRLWDHLQFPLGLASLAPIAAWTVALGLVSAIALAWRNKQRLVLAMGVLFVVSVVAAVAIYFPAAPGDGDGYRLYYLATLGIALIVSAASTSASRSASLGMVALLAAMAFWQARVTDEWHRASIEMNGAMTAIKRVATALSPQEYGLVLLPDHLGHVPFARNAQGALPKLAGLSTPPLDVLSRLVVFTPPQVDEWHRLAQENVVQKITPRRDAPPNPTQYFCWDGTTQTLQSLGFWAPGTLEDWRLKWRNSVAAACPRASAESG